MEVVVRTEVAVRTPIQIQDRVVGLDNDYMVGYIYRRCADLALRDGCYEYLGLDYDMR